MKLSFPGVAFVTGAGSGESETGARESWNAWLNRLGIGRATALLYAQEGCKRIAIADIQKESIAQLQKEMEEQYPDANVEALHIGTSDSPMAKKGQYRPPHKKGNI